jgi:hypothetical protein
MVGLFVRKKTLDSVLFYHTERRINAKQIAREWMKQCHLKNTETLGIPNLSWTFASRQSIEQVIFSIFWGIRLKFITKGNYGAETFHYWRKLCNETVRAPIDRL